MGPHIESGGVGGAPEGDRMLMERCCRHHASGPVLPQLHYHFFSELIVLLNATRTAS